MNSPLYQTEKPLSFENFTVFAPLFACWESLFFG